jgi:hypothetical protein
VIVIRQKRGETLDGSEVNLPWDAVYLVENGEERCVAYIPRQEGEPVIQMVARVSPAIQAEIAREVKGSYFAQLQIQEIP